MVKNNAVSRKDFNEAYFEFASQYVAGIRLNLAKKADEVFADKALVVMVMNLHTKAQEKKQAQQREFEAYMNGEEPVVLSTFASQEVSAYKSVLYDLLIKGEDYDQNLED